LALISPAQAQQAGILLELLLLLVVVVVVAAQAPASPEWAQQAGLLLLVLLVLLLQVVGVAPTGSSNNTQNAHSGSAAASRALNMSSVAWLHCTNALG
jgi:uncharacterized protein (UPF0333 family)